MRPVGVGDGSVLDGLPLEAVEEEDDGHHQGGNNPPRHRPIVVGPKNKTFCVQQVALLNRFSLGTL